jgi:hypothetical protein
MPIPKKTPASARICAGLSVSGGPTGVPCFSQLSGAPRLPVRMTGIDAAARDFATYCHVRFSRLGKGSNIFMGIGTY